MRKYALLAAAAGLALSGSLAKADFVVTSTRTPLSSAPTAGSNTYPGFDLVQFFAKATSGGVLTSTTSTLSDATGPNLVVGYTNGSETTQDYSGATEIFTNGTKSVAPTIYVFKTSDTTAGSPPIYSAITVLGDPSNTSENSASSVLSVGGVDNPLTVSNAYTVQSMTLNAGNTATDQIGQPNNTGANNGVDAVNANGGRGALIAIAVVPTGETVTDQGTLNQGTTPFSFSAVNGVPEPATLGLFGMFGAGLLARRRRA